MSVSAFGMQGYGGFQNAYGNVNPQYLQPTQPFAANPFMPPVWNSFGGGIPYAGFSQQIGGLLAQTSGQFLPTNMFPSFPPTFSPFTGQLPGLVSFDVRNGGVLNGGSGFVSPLGYGNPLGNPYGYVGPTLSNPFGQANGGIQYAGQSGYMGFM